MATNDLWIGIRRIYDGIVATARGDKFANTCTIFGRAGMYAEPAARGQVFVACTAVAGVAPGTALSTTPPMILWNPPGSGVNLVIMKTALGYVSGTLGAGTMVYAQYPQTTTPTTGTVLAPVSTLLGSKAGYGQAFQGSTLAGTPTIVRSAYVIGAFLASSVVQPIESVDFVDGEIVVPPGNAFVMQEVGAAGTSPLTLLTVVWGEEPI